MSLKNTLLVLFIQFFVILVLEMGNPFLPSYLASLTTSSTEVWATLCYAAPMIGLIISSPMWGRVGDRFGHKKMLLRAVFGLIVSQALVACVHSPFELVLVGLFQGTMAGFITAMQCYVLTQVAWDKKGHILGQMQSAKACGTSLGAIAGGILISYSSYRFVYASAAIGCTIALLLITLYLPNDKPSNNAIKGSDRNLFYRALSIQVFIVLLMIGIIQIIKFMPLPSFSLFSTQVLSSNSMVTGFLYAVPGISILFFSSPMGKLFDKIRLKSIEKDTSSYVIAYYMSLSILASFTLFIHSLGTNLFLLIIIRLIWGVCLAGLLPSCYSLLTDYSSSNNKGFIIGVANSIAKMGNLVGILLGGLLASFGSYQLVFRIMSYGYLALSLASIVAMVITIHSQTKKHRYAQLY